MGGAEQRLRPKTFQVLLYLLERRPNLVTKEELLARCWKDTAVGDDALVQCVIDIRKALGDDPRNPRYIQTVPKAGYRFIAPAEEIHPGKAAEHVTTLQVEYEEEIEDTAHRALPPGPGRNRLIAAVVVMLLIAAASFAAWYSTRPRAEVSLAQFPGKQPVAVMYFDNQSRSPELDWLREGLADMFITNLSRFSGLTVLSRHQLYLLRERAGHDQTAPTKLEEAIEIARRSHASVIVLGSFAQIGGRIRLSAALHDARSGRMTAAESLLLDRPADILTQADILSTRLAAHLGAVPPEPGRGLADVSSNKIEAYRYYSLAMEKAHAVQDAAAVELLEKAVALDPEFAMAEAGLGHVYVMWGLYPEKAKIHLERALRLSSRLTDKDKLFVKASYATISHDFSEAARILREIVTNYPLEIEAYWRLGRVLEGEEQLEEAAGVLRQGLVVDPEAKDLYNSLGNIFSEMGRHGEAIAAEQKYVALVPGDPNPHDSLGMAYQWAGQYDLALEEYNRSLTLNPRFVTAGWHRAGLYFQIGRYAAAVRELQDTIPQVTADLERERGYYEIASLYLRKGDLRSAESASRELKNYPVAFGVVPLQIALYKGDLATAAKWRDSLSLDSPVTNRGARDSKRRLYYGHGVFALKTGHSSEGIDNFKEALGRRPPRWLLDPFEDCLANAYLQLGRLDEAIVEYTRVLRLNPNHALSRYHLGRAYEQRGQREAARAEYERFLSIWKDADADIPELIDGKRRWSMIAREAVQR